jgi:hypothetical protein
MLLYFDAAVLPLRAAFQLESALARGKQQEHSRMQRRSLQPCLAQVFPNAVLEEIRVGWFCSGRCVR